MVAVYGDGGVGGGMDSGWVVVEMVVVAEVILVVEVVLSFMEVVETTRLKRRALFF